MKSNTTISKVPFLGYSSSQVLLFYCSSEALFFMIRNTEMDSEHFVYKYSFSFRINLDVCIMQLFLIIQTGS